MAYHLKENVMKEDRFTGGHRMCAGCGCPIAVRTVLRALEPEEPIQVDDLIQATGIPARRVSSALTMLEIDGCVQQHSGKRYTRLVTLAE